MRSERGACALVLLGALLLSCAPRVTPPPVTGVVTRATPAATFAPRATPSATAIAAATPPPAASATPAPCTHTLPPAPTGPLHTLAFFDIGQGDSELIRTASGKTVLVDSGDRDHAAALMADLAKLGVTRIDLLLASHPHLDHIGAMPELLGKLPVRLYSDPGTDHPTETYRELLHSVAEKKIPYQVLRAGKTLSLGDEATLTVISPPADHLLHTERSPENANSVVMKLTIGSFNALYTGDAEPETLASLASSLGHVDLLKIAHHGSRWGTSAALLDEVTPSVATISVGAKNDYHHPHRETVALLNERCIPTFRTDRDGTITLVTDGKGWRMTSERGTTFETATAGSGGDDPHPEGPRAETMPTTGASPLATATPATGLPRGPPEQASGSSVFASRRGKIFHPANCVHLAKIKPENLVEFSSASEAEAAGLHAGSGCRVEAGGTKAAPSPVEDKKSDDGSDEGTTKKKRHKRGSG